MFRLWTESKSPYWRAQYFDSYGNDRKYRLADFPKEMPKDRVAAEVMPEAARQYVIFLHRQNTWKRLEIRNYDIKRMYHRIQLFHSHYSIEEFAFDLRELGIVPAPAKQAASCRRKERSRYTRINTRNKRYEFKGKKHTINEWAAEFGLNPKTINMRINRGWDMERVLNTPSIDRSEKGRMGAAKRWGKR